MRYMDVTNRLVASPALPIDIWRSQRGRCCTESISTSTLPMPSAVFLLTRNIGAATSRLVTSLYRTVSPRKALLPTYTFSEIKFYFSTRWFLDIEKSVRLKLKGVKIIRRYRDLFQLIRYLFQLIYSGFSDWELIWFCIVVHRHLPASVKYKQSSVAIGALVTLCLLYHSSF